MNEKQQKVAIGCLLHDFGKLLYRYNDGRNHSTSGYEYIKGLPSLSNENEILNCIKYHHYEFLKNAKINEDDISYIAYIADNIASATDRRTKDDEGSGFVRNIAFESVFNILNGNKQQMVYHPTVMFENMKINYPTVDEISFNESFYAKIIDNIKNALNGIYYRFHLKV